MKDFAHKVNLFGVGLEKCGTSSLHTLISESRNVESPREKETMFFSEKFDKGYDYYFGLFERNDGARVRIDFTPSYCRFADALTRIADVPNRKVILSLRHPVERAFSLYVHDIANHYATGERTHEDGRIFLRPFGRSFFDVVAENHDYYMSKYADLVATCLELYGRRDFRVIVFEQWIESSPRDLLRYFSEFLGEDLGNTHRERLPFENARSMPFYLNVARSQPGDIYDRYFGIRTNGLHLVDDGRVLGFAGLDRDQIDSALSAAAKWTDFVPEEYARKIYSEYFHDDVLQLEKLLDVDLSCWRAFRDIGYAKKYPVLWNDRSA